MNPYCVTIHVKASKEYFPVVLFIMSHKKELGFEITYFSSYTFGTTGAGTSSSDSDSLGSKSVEMKRLQVSNK